MYEEKKAFPIKWIILAVSILVLIIGFVAYNNYQKNKREKSYLDMIAKIIKAGEDYGYDNKKTNNELEEECLSLENLIKNGYLESSSKKEPIIIDPRTGDKMDGEVIVVYQGDDEVTADYLFKEKCRVDYDKKVKIIIKEKTTRSFVIALDAPEAIRLSSFEYKIDDKNFFQHDAPTYKFDELLSGNHRVVVRATDYLNNTYERTEQVVLDKLIAPTLEYNEETAVVTVLCPPSEDENVNCVYTIDSENWTKVNEENSKVEFKEDGKIIAQVRDGFNATEPVVQEVKVKPSCIDSQWSTCTGCDAGCGQNCEGTQTSNCGNTRPCTIVGTCTSLPPVTTYTVTVKASNGDPLTQSQNVPSGFNRVFTVSPKSGYEFSNVSCTSGTANYSSRSNQLTVNNVDNARTCTVNFTKKDIIPTVYKVTFVGFDGKTIEVKSVQSGKTVSAVTVPTIPGYTFQTWTKNGVTYNFSTPVTSNITLNAKYLVNKIAVTFDTDGGSTVYTQYIISGQKAIKPNDPSKAAFKFSGWYLNGSPYDFNSPVTSPITLRANWLPLISKTVVFNGVDTSMNVTLTGFRGLHRITDTCVNNVSSTMSGAVINLVLSSAESCQVNIEYY